MQNKALKLTIEPDGTARAIYSDDLRELLDEGSSTVNRASHVEPEGKDWFVDLSPVGGPGRVGPFRLREDALAYEVQWLEKNWL